MAARGLALPSYSRIWLMEDPPSSTCGFRVHIGHSTGKSGKEDVEDQVGIFMGLADRPYSSVCISTVRTQPGASTELKGRRRNDFQLCSNQTEAVWILALAFSQMANLGTFLIALNLSVHSFIMRWWCRRRGGWVGQSLMEAVGGELAGVLETHSENPSWKEAEDASLTVPLTVYLLLSASQNRSRSHSPNPMSSKWREPWLCANQGKWAHSPSVSWIL